MAKERGLGVGRIGVGDLEEGKAILYLLTRGRNSHRFFKTILVGKGNWKGKNKVIRIRVASTIGQVTEAWVSLFRPASGPLVFRSASEFSWLILCWRVRQDLSGWA